MLFYKQISGTIVVYSQEDPADPAWFQVKEKKKKEIKKREQERGKEKKNGEQAPSWALEIPDS